MARRRGGRAPRAATTAAPAAAYESPHLLSEPGCWILAEGGGRRAGDEGGDLSLKDASKDPGDLAPETAPGLRVVRGGESVPRRQAGFRLCSPEGRLASIVGWQGRGGLLHHTRVLVFCPADSNCASFAVLGCTKSVDSLSLGQLFPTG